MASCSIASFAGSGIAPRFAEDERSVESERWRGEEAKGYREEEAKGYRKEEAKGYREEEAKGYREEEEIVGGRDKEMEKERERERPHFLHTNLVTKRRSETRIPHSSKYNKHNKHSRTYSGRVDLI